MVRENMNNEKTYRFISDPGHKENLSGRVRAACVNCRRKKTKCSGEIPCGTCDEKDVVCEGLTERKRPTKHAGRRSRASSTRRSSQDFGSEDGALLSKRNSFDSSSSMMDRSDETVTRPTAHLRKRVTNDSEDSGYGSGTPTLQMEAQLPFNYSFGQETSSNRNETPAISPLGNAHQDWGLASQLELAALSATDSTESRTSPGPRATTTAVSTQSMDWLDARARSKFWIDGNTASAHAANKLLTAAEALERQAKTLRRLADQEPADEVRRQTITFPIYNLYAAALDDPTQQLCGPYDDLSLMLDERTSRTGLTPPAIDVSSWWDIHPELSASYGFHPHSTTVPSVLRGSSAETTWPSTPTSNSAAPSRNSAKLSEQGIDTRQAAPRYHDPSQNGYGQLYPWPE